MPQNSQDEIDLQLSLGSAADASDLPPLDIKPMPGFLRFLPPLLKKMAELGVAFRMNQDGALYVDGFYKNGPMKLDLDEQNNIFAVDKRDRRTAIGHYDDLVLLNFTWWKLSNSRNQVAMPERPWLDSFIEKKWVKRRVIFEPIDDVVGDLPGDED